MLDRIPEQKTKAGANIRLKRVSRLQTNLLDYNTYTEMSLLGEMALRKSKEVLLELD